MKDIIIHMGEIIKYPSWIVEKERALAKLEFQLSIEKIEIERKKIEIERKKSRLKFENLIFFSMGMTIPLTIILFLYMIT